jgi:uncharacterized alpha-E superfamily protein
MSLMPDPSRGTWRSTVDGGSRPLLARVAESIYWCARYVERAEHLARAAWVTSQVASDAGDLDAGLRDRLWFGLIEAFDLPPLAEAPRDPADLGPAVVAHLTVDADGLSAASVIAQARHNARAVRSEISTEMWETLNELYWALEGVGDGDGVRRMLAESPEALLRFLMRQSMLFQGVSDQTLMHGGRWDFAMAGRMIERADATCRMVRARARLLAAAGTGFEPPLRNIQLMTALRMCCSIEAYRRQHPDSLSLGQVAAFVLLRGDHPRSARFAVGMARKAVARIHRASGTGRPGLAEAIDPAERLLGRLDARLEYADAADIAGGALEPFVEHLRTTLAQADQALHTRYFAA